MVSRSSTTRSGGRPPLDWPRSIDPRQGWNRRPSCSATSISASSRPVTPGGKAEWCSGAAERQLGEADLGGGALPVGIDRRPDRIELAEPVEEAALLRMDPREGLVEVMVRVDQPRQRDQATAVNDVRLLANGRAPLPNPADHAPVDQDRTVLQLRAGVVHGDDDPATVEQDHGRARKREAARLTASTIFWYPVQRQRLPLSASRTVAGLGFGSFRSRSVTATTNPGVQKPH